MKNADHYNTLKSYLNKAFAKQAWLLPKWMEENADLIKTSKENRKKVLAEINGSNEAFWETDEGKAIMRNNRNFEQAQQTWVYIENNSPRCPGYTRKWYWNNHSLWFKQILRL